jgi:hypothetical protein
MARFGVFLSRGRLGNYDANSSLASGCNGGREGARTPDLLVANAKNHTQSKPVIRKCFPLNGCKGLLGTARVFTGQQNQHKNQHIYFLDFLSFFLAFRHSTATKCLHRDGR